MKILCLFSFIAFLLLFSCSQKQKIEPNFYNGFASLTINGKPFESLSGAVKIKEKNAYCLSVETRDVERDKSIKLSFGFVLNNDRKQILLKRNSNDRSSAQANLMVMNKNVLYSYYELIENDTLQNYFQFIYFDESTGEIKGNFEASFVIDSISNLDPFAPDTIVIADGYFEIINFSICSPNFIK